MSEFVYDRDTWFPLDSYFNLKDIHVKHQIDSFDYFVDYIIPRIIENNNPILIGTNLHDGEYEKLCTISFTQTYMSKPLIHESNDVINVLYPNIARLRSLTYSAPMFVDITIKLDDRTTGNTTEITEEKVPFMKLPIMIKSKYCHLSEFNEQSAKECGECEYDQGGYFIVNGGEKVIVSQERVAENKVYVWPPSKSPTGKFTHEAEIKSSLDQHCYPIKVNKVRLSKEPTSRKIQECKKLDIVCGRTLYAGVPNIKDDIPLFILFRALGIEREVDIFNMILPDMNSINSSYVNFLVPSADEARSKGVTTQQTALDYLSKKLNISFTDAFKKDHQEAQMKYVVDILYRELFPHMGQIQLDLGQSFKKKAMFLGYMTRRLIDCYFGIRPYDDRDHYSNKRVDLAGHLLTKIFRVNYIKLIKDIRQKVLNAVSDNSDIQKITTIVRKQIQGCLIDSKIKYALSTGNWETQKGSSSATTKGIAQVLNRISYAAALSHTRRIQSPLERSGSKIVQPRKLHNTHFGMCCLNETPEGAQIGIVKNLALQTHITIQTNDAPVRQILSKLGVDDLVNCDLSTLQYCTKIFVNGDWYGVIRDFVKTSDGTIKNQVYDLYNKLKTLKRHGILVPYISIAWFIDWKEIRILTDGGRYSRPLYIVHDNELLIKKVMTEDLHTKMVNHQITWSQYVTGFDQIDPSKTRPSPYNGAVIEYMDTCEVENAMIAMNYADITSNSYENPCYVNYSHCEIHPLMMMGIISSMIPFSDHNQSPRNCYQSAMCKQSIGCYATNYNSRMDTMSHILVYGHRPLVTTRADKYTKFNDLPHGTTTMLLYGCFTGFNQEDSIIINKDAVDRGFFNTIFSRTYTEKVVKHRMGNSTTVEKFTKPNKETTRGIKFGGSYDKIDSNGKPILGASVDGGDVIIGKVVESRVKERDREDVSQAKDVSEQVRNNEHGVIDMVIPDNKGLVLPFNSEGNQFIKARVSTLRKPEIGDKFASRYSQKGTTGILFRGVDMPFTSGGLVPDIIMNPHGIPSRMTVGKLLETMLGKIAVCTGQLQDATPFMSYDINDFSKTLESFGFDKYGNEVMYNGLTGQMYSTVLFYGPTYYQRLKHMVADKVHCLTDDHEVLTTDGWKCISSVTVNDSVATLVNGNLEYCHPMEVLHYHQYEGDMYHVSNQSVSLNVTINHRMWASLHDDQSNQWCPVGMINTSDVVGKSVRYYNHANWSVQDYQFTFPSNTTHAPIDMNSWLTLFGHWMTTGCTLPNSGVQITSSKTVNIASYALGYHPTGHMNNTIIYNKKLHTYLSQYDNSTTDRHLPEWVWKLSQNQCRKLIKALQLDIDTNIYTTSSSKLADDLTRLCLHAGWAATKRRDYNDQWRVTIISNNEEVIGKSSEVYHYTGPVYCLRVPSEVFYVRRYGVPIWTGNSRESGPVQLLTRQPAEGRSRDGGLRLGEMERDALIAHGIPKFLKERMMDASDLFKAYVSKKEQVMIVANPEKDIFKYGTKSIRDDEVCQIQLPYAMKLLLQELQSMGLDIRPEMV